MSHYKLSVLNRLKACWYILSNKEFYMEVIVSRYDNGEELAAVVLSNMYDTETAIKRMKKGLNLAMQMLKQENKRIEQ
jgi:hypothetical protein